MVRTPHDIQFDAPSPSDDYRRRGWWPDESLAVRFARHVDAAPDEIVLADEHGNTLTRAQLWAQAGRLGEELGRGGLSAGEVVVVCLPNWMTWQVVFLACLRAGAIPATLPVHTDSETLGYVSELVGARVIVAAQRYQTRETGEQAVSAARELESDVDVVLIGEDGSRRWVRQGGGGLPAGPRRPPGTAHLMYTSSTTGKPKAVVHTENTLAAVNIGFAERFGITERQPIFMPSPLGHSVGAWHGARLSLFTGAPLVIQDVWDPERAAALVERRHCAFTAAATPFLTDLLSVDRAGMPGLRTFLCGGAPVPPVLVERAAERIPHTFVSVLWGMTEGGVTTCVPGDPPERVAATAGTGLPGLELHTVAPEGPATPPGEPGELVMRGPGVFVGYLGQDELYETSCTADGYFRTGDQATLDEYGYLRITGRIKDLIIRGGVNISPIPLESTLVAHPAIEHVAVIGLPDERLGELICAVIVPTGQPPELATLLDWLADRGVPKRQWPERLCVVDQMPRTPAGKIRKADLKERVVRGRA